MTGRNAAAFISRRIERPERLYRATWTNSIYVNCVDTAGLLPDHWSIIFQRKIPAKGIKAVEKTEPLSKTRETSLARVTAVIAFALR